MNKSNLKLQALICVVNPDLENDLVEILNQNGARGINILLGHGAKKFNLLEFNHKHKSVIVSFIRAETEKTTMQILTGHDIIGKEKGIAFTINIDASAGGKSIFNFYDKIQAYFQDKNPEEVFDKEKPSDIGTKTATGELKENSDILSKSGERSFKNEKRNRG